MAMKVTKKRLVNAAAELNKVLGLEPEIDVTQDEETIIRDIREAAELLQPEDELTNATLKTLNELEAALTSATEVAAIADDEDDEGNDAPATEEAAPAEAEPKKSTKSAPKKKAAPETTPLGSRKGTQAEKMDNVILNAGKALTVDEIVEQSGFSKSRVKLHLNHLLKKGLLQETDGTYQPK